LKKKQKLVTVHVTTAPAPGEPSIVPVGGETLEALLEQWRVLQIQPLGQRTGDTYTALLLLEEAPSEPSLGRLGFGHE